MRDLEKNFFARELKIVLQHNRSESGQIASHRRNDAWAISGLRHRNKIREIQPGNCKYPRAFAAADATSISSATGREWGLAQGAGAPGQATASATTAAAPDTASKAAAASASAAAASPAAASSAAASSASAAATAMTASAATASNELKAGGDRSFLVEHIERRQADVRDFFLTERQFVARLDMPRRDIRGRASRLRR